MSSIVRQVVTEDSWEIEVAGGAVFVITRAQWEAFPGNLEQRISRLRTAAANILGPNFQGPRCLITLNPDGSLADVTHDQTLVV